MKIQRAKTMIYITEFDVNSSTISHGLGRASYWRAKGSDAGPHLKTPYRNRVLFFKVVTFSIPVLILNITLHADIIHIRQSNNF